MVKVWWHVRNLGNGIWESGFWDTLKISTSTRFYHVYFQVGNKWPFIRSRFGIYISKNLAYFQFMYLKKKKILGGYVFGDCKLYSHFLFLLLSLVFINSNAIGIQNNIEIIISITVKLKGFNEIYKCGSIRLSSRNSRILNYSFFIFVTKRLLYH